MSVKKLTKRLSQDAFIKNNAIFFIGSMIVAVLNYAYHPIMSRLMSVEDFGEVQTLISLTYLTGIILMIFKIIAVNIISNHSDSSSDDHITLLSQLQKLSLYVIFIFAVAIIVVSPYLATLFHFNSIISFIPLSFILIVGVPFTFYDAYLQGSHHFTTTSIAGIITSGGRLLFAVILVLLGLRVFGAITAVALATLSALFYAISQTRGKFRLSLKQKFSFSKPLQKELSYGILIFFSLGYITFLYTSDVLFVKHFFDPETAGLYSGIATIARIIFFATASVAGVLLPTIKINAPKGKNTEILLKAFAIISLLGIGILAFFFLFPTFVISFLIGGSYLPFAHLLPLAGVYIFLASLTNLFYSYFLALRDRSLVVISSIGFVVTTALVLFRHGSPSDIIVSYIAGSLLTILILSVYFGLKYFHGKQKLH